MRKEIVVYRISKIIPKSIRKVVKLFYNPVIPCVQKLDYGERVMSEQEEAFFINKLKEIKDIEGDVIEFGVFRGGSLLAMARNTNKTIYGLDTFEGLPMLSKDDGLILKLYRESMNDNNFNKVKKVFENYSNVMLLKGLVKQSLLYFESNKFCFAYVDLDLYEGTKQALEFLIPRMNKGGIIVIDDFYSKIYTGVKKAVLEFFKEENFIKNGSQVYIKM